MANKQDENIYAETFTPREYQVELLDAALKKNIIVHLGTGSGKTFIAVMLIRELAQDIRKKYENGGKRTVFIVKDVPLVKQQGAYIERLTDLTVGCYSGDMQVDFWLKNRWNEEFRKNQVLVMTSGVFRLVLEHGFMTLDRVNLVIADECHHAVKHSNLREIMKRFVDYEEKVHPRVMGLTASILNSQCDPCKVRGCVHQLEKTMRCTVETASDIMSAQGYCTNPDEYVIEYKKHGDSSELEKKLLYMIKVARDFIFDYIKPEEIYGGEEDLSESLKKIPDLLAHPKKILMDFELVLTSLGPWCANIAALIFLIYIEKLKMRTTFEQQYLFLCMVYTVMLKVRTLCEEHFQNYERKERIYKFSTPRILQLINILRQYKPICFEDSNDDQNSNDLKNLYCIIFVERRIVAKILYHLLQDLSKCDPSFGFLRPLYIIGSSANPLDGTREAELEIRKQEEVLRRFRTHECNTLISTSILEEGIDIPKCSLVIRFNLPKEFRGYIQSKGRARASKARYVLMVEESEMSRFIDNIAQYIVIEELLQEICHNRESPNKEDMDADAANYLLEPYKPSNVHGEACVTMLSAISLVNRYCSKLPSDAFTHLTPIWHVESEECNTFGDGKTGYVCHLQLPINSPVKETIIGKIMPSKVDARRAAALAACIILHEKNELDDHLLPVGEESTQYEEDLLEPWEKEEVEEGAPRPGTTKRRQYYYKRIADCLTNCQPHAYEPAYLYSIRMILTCPIPEEHLTRGRKIHPPEASAQMFGIFTAKKMPKMCPFPIFTRYGEVCVDLELVAMNLALTEEQLHKVAVFHKYLFTSALCFEKHQMKFSPECAESSVFIVPLCQASDVGKPVLNWSILDSIYTGCELKPLRDEERSKLQFQPEKYQDCVIMPWYRNQDQPKYYDVVKICKELNPKSDFPDDEFETFEDYYFNKYNLQIQNMEQPMLDVTLTDRCIIFFPRYLNRKGVALFQSSKKTQKAQSENTGQKQVLVPELCTVHPFSASFWRKAVCLPCILFRMNALLLSNQLRVQVSKGINVGHEEITDDMSWPPLDFGWNLAVALEKQSHVKEVKNGEAERKIGSKNVNQEVENESAEGFRNIEKSTHLCSTTDKEDLRTEEEVRLLLNIVEKQLKNEHLEAGTDEMTEESKICKNSSYSDDSNPNVVLLENVTMLDGSDVELANIMKEDPGRDCGTRIKEKGLRVASPSAFESVQVCRMRDETTLCSDDKLRDMGLQRDSESDDDDDDDDTLENESLENKFGLKIEYKGEDIAEAIEDTSEEWKIILDCFQNEKDTEWKWDWDFSIDTVTLGDIKQNEEIIRGIMNKCNESDTFVDVEAEDLEDKHQYIQEETNIIDLNFIKKGHNQSAEDVLTESCSSVSQEYLQHNVAAEEVGQTESASDLLNEDEMNNLTEEEQDDALWFSFDKQPDLKDHPGPSPSIILQALTLSNANDGINLERLETIGDSFLKYSITTYLYCMYPDIHEGKLTNLRSKQVSNLNLYRLGKRKGFGEYMVATHLEPYDNWLPPCYYVLKEYEQAVIDSSVSASQENIADLPELIKMKMYDRYCIVKEQSGQTNSRHGAGGSDGKPLQQDSSIKEQPSIISHSMLTHHSIPDKSIADCVEALIGAYLTSCGPRGALLFMSWLGIRVLPKIYGNQQDEDMNKTAGEKCMPGEQVLYGYLAQPSSPLLQQVPGAKEQLTFLLNGFDKFEEKIRYTFSDQSYLLQAITHTSYHRNRVTDCYQRLEFLGDAVLDYLITRHLYEDPRQHSPGALTDLRSALVNNITFASLAVKYDFHKYLRHFSPVLHVVVDKFVQIQERNGHQINRNYYLIDGTEYEEAEDVEVPKALGDVFESVAGAIYLDSEMSLDAVWKVYYRMMKTEIEEFSANVPKSPVRELFELMPGALNFRKPQILADEGKVRVTVEVFGKGVYSGIGRNHRIAKCTAAKCALRAIKKKGLTSRA